MKSYICFNSQYEWTAVHCPRIERYDDTKLIMTSIPSFSIIHQIGIQTDCYMKIGYYCIKLYCTAQCSNVFFSVFHKETNACMVTYPLPMFLETHVCECIIPFEGVYEVGLFFKDTEIAGQCVFHKLQLYHSQYLEKPFPILIDPPTSVITTLQSYTDIQQNMIQFFYEWKSMLEMLDTIIQWLYQIKRTAQSLLHDLHDPLIPTTASSEGGSLQLLLLELLQYNNLNEQFITLGNGDGGEIELTQYHKLPKFPLHLWKQYVMETPSNLKPIIISVSQLLHEYVINRQNLNDIFSSIQNKNVI